MGGARAGTVGPRGGPPVTLCRVVKGDGRGRGALARQQGLTSCIPRMGLTFAGLRLWSSPRSPATGRTEAGAEGEGTDLRLALSTPERERRSRPHQHNRAYSFLVSRPAEGGAEAETHHTF